MCASQWGGDEEQLMNRIITHTVLQMKKKHVSKAFNRKRGGLQHEAR